MSAARLGCALVLLLCAGGAQANHDWGGIDVCTAYRDTAPPGFDPQALPQPDSAGAQVLQRYCVQCHALPGPGRHTAEEWPAVVERMVTLMDVSRRFRGLMGRIDMPDMQQQQALREYLRAHALEAMTEAPAGEGGAAYARTCGACHALPDPRQHPADQWPAVVARMERNAQVMGRAWDGQGALQSVAWLQGRERGTGLQPHGGGSLPRPDPRDRSAPGAGAFAPLVWLVPFFVLAAVGALRWWRAARRHSGDHRP